MIRRDVGVLGQVQQIDDAVNRLKGDRFSPDLVDAFHHQGNALPPGSRIMAVADVFAALTEEFSRCAGGRGDGPDMA